MHAYRSHHCGALRLTEAGQRTRLSGWCHRVRDHGGVLFIDLRDHYGLTQCVVDPSSPAFAQAERIRSEWVVRIDGEVRPRPQGTQNPQMATGDIEIHVTDIEVLSEADELPMPVFGEVDYPEETRLKYRFLDLRRERMHRNMMLRESVTESLRQQMRAAGFHEFQTPILTASSPEGARDYLVPSRIHPNKFYALPQAPQQYKQLLMMAGFDRYFQVAPCFRDEDPRADRLPGCFYQLDIEMSFVTQDEIFATFEPILTHIFETYGGGRSVTKNWPRIPYHEAMRKYGTDKPDLRNPIIMQDVSEHFKGSGFKIFARILEQEGAQIWAIPAPTGGQRGFCDRMNSWARDEGQVGLGNIFWREDEGVMTPVGPIANNIGPERTEALRQALGLKVGDAAFFVAGDPKQFVKFAGAARTKVAEELSLIDRNRFEFAWIVDFPMYEWNDEQKKIDFSHNPFSMPQGEMSALTDQNPLDVKAFQYDISCNGYELASGGIRNHRTDVMVKAFELAGYGAEEVEMRFGALYNAFRYGAPPHGGLAAGIERIIMLLADEQNVREVSLFPMNQRAEDVLMGAPAEVSMQQLRELHLRLNPVAKSV